MEDDVHLGTLQALSPRICSISSNKALENDDGSFAA
jgi:hypothetical protein